MERVLGAAANALPVYAVEGVTKELQSLLGATEASFLIVDLSGRGLARLKPQPDPLNAALSSDSAPPEALPYDGGPREVAMRTQRVQVVAPRHLSPTEMSSSNWTILAPVTERGEPLGLLEVFLPSEPDAQALAEIARIAHVLSFVVLANDRHTDLFEAGQRQDALTLPAEIQRRLLPASLICEVGPITVAGWLEPATEIAGDTFDYTLESDDLHLSITDAMGHGIVSSLIATLCVSSLRNSRREGLELSQQAAAANNALRSHGSLINNGFASGQLGRINLRSGVLSLVNAGHVPPYLCRANSITALELPIDLPMGAVSDTRYRVTEIPLEEGDRVVFVTDGMLERNATNVDLIRCLGDSTELHPREATRYLADCVLDATEGTLTDDATLVMVDWRGT